MFSGYGGDEVAETACLVSDRVKRHIILEFLKESAGFKKSATNYATADFYEEHGLPNIATWIRRKT